MSKFCSNCGKELKEKETICSNCGTIIQSEASSADKKAVTGLVLGLISIIAWILPLAGYPISICGVVFSSKGLKSTTNKGKAIAGLILSIIFLAFTFFNSLLGAMSAIYNLH